MCAIFKSEFEFTIIIYILTEFVVRFSSSAKVEGVHKEFQKTAGAGECRYIPEKAVLQLISRHESSQKRAQMIQDMHFRNLTQKVSRFDLIFTIIPKNSLG